MSIKAQIPNALTLFRYAAVAMLLAAWFMPAPYGTWGPLIIVVLASITDFFDGYLARKWKVESELGRLLDPNADKLLIAAALILLASNGFADVVAVVLILSRELFISGLREFMAERNITVHVTKLAKWKTTTQMFAIILLLFAYACGCLISKIYADWILWIATGLTLVTGFQYLRSSLASLR